MSAAAAGSRTGERVELGRYYAGREHRIIFGARVNGVVRLTDHPVGGSGRRYLIERGLEEDGMAAVEALVADYVLQAQIHNGIPMHYRPLTQ